MCFLPSNLTPVDPGTQGKFFGTRQEREQFKYQ